MEKRKLTQKIKDLLIGREKEIALLTSIIEALDTEEGPVDVIVIEVFKLHPFFDTYQSHCE